MRETLDYGSWWVQGYQSEAFGAHGDVFRALTGNGPYVVPKDGGAVFTFSSAEPVDTQMDRLRSATEVMRRALAAASHSPDEAGQFVEMVRSRRYVPFRATTPATALTRDVASVLALRFLSTPSDTDGVERILLGEPVDAGSAWVFFFQGRGYVERGDLDEMLVGNMPVVIPIDGRPPYAFDPRESTDVQIERLREDGAHRG